MKGNIYLFTTLLYEIYHFLFKLPVVILIFTLLVVNCGDDTEGETAAARDFLYIDGAHVDNLNRLNISQFGITWTFDKEYEYGQFANGDFYVIGPVTIVSVTPAPSGGRNGSMVNPVTTDIQAYDDRTYYYDAAYLPVFPYDMSAGESLVSTVSRTDETTDYAGRTVGSSHSYLLTAAVLTCLPGRPADGSFRPPYIGTDKPIYNTAQLQTNLLTDLPAVASVPPDWGLKDFIEYFKRSLERPWIVHSPGFTSRLLHPLSNMPNYHAQIGAFWSQVSLALLTDGISSSEKLEIVIRYVQTGIDIYYMSISGSGDSAFNKWPVIFTGIMLDEPDIYNLTNVAYEPREDSMTYYLTDIRSPYSSSIITAGDLWTGYIAVTPRPAWAQDRGEHEHEHLDPGEWGQISDGGGQKREAYRAINSPTWVGEMLSALIMGAKTTWNHPAFFDYMDRWMNEDGNYVTGLVSAVWDGQQYGNPDPDLYQTGGSAFIDEMWTTYRSSY